MLSLQAEALSKGFGVPQQQPQGLQNGGPPLAALHGLQPWVNPSSGLPPSSEAHAATC